MKNKPIPPPSLVIREGSTKVTYIPAVRTDSLSEVFMRQIDSLNPKNNRLTEAEGKQILKELIKNYSDDIDSATTSDGWGDKTFIMESIVDELIKRLTK